MAWRKTPFKIKPELWDETKDAYELARLMKVTPHAIRLYARKFGLRYQLRKWGRGLNGGGGKKISLDAMGNPIEVTEKLKSIRNLIKQWRNGSDEAGRELLVYGIRARRCD